MRFTRRLGPAAAGIFVVVTAFSPDGTGVHASAASAHPVNLSTAPAVDQYLASIGVDPGKAVHQTGSRNYAGPNCPGAGWNCTSSKQAVVVQTASADGINVFQCTPAGAGTNPSTDTCVVVQTAPSSGDNNAVCKETATNTAPSPSCSITQTNTTGKNVATVDQQWSQSSGDAQSASETTTIAQQNTSGQNNANVEQGIAQKIKDHAASQDQEATQLTCVQQDSPSGANHALVRQQVTQNAQETGSGTSQTQNQNAGPDSTCGSASTTISPNLAALVQQDQGSPSDSGPNSSTIQQSLHQKMLSYPSTGSVFQQQGNNGDLGGLEANPDQNSTGVSQANTDQNENQVEDAETTGLLTQDQFDPIHQPSGEGVQASNPNDTFTLTQEGVQNADDGASQGWDMQGDCTSSGLCSVTQTQTSNGGTNQTTCTTSPCSVIQFNEGG